MSTVKKKAPFELVKTSRKTLYFDYLGVVRTVKRGPQGAIIPVKEYLLRKKHKHASCTVAHLLEQASHIHYLLLNKGHSCT